MQEQQPTPPRSIGRWSAAGIHLLISATVVGVVAAVLIGLWYGWTLFGALGADQLLLILASVDVIAGPLLTLIVYRAGKPSLRFDLTVIALLQAAFLSYGVYIMAQSRPAFIVGVFDRFDVVFANETDPDRLASSPLAEARQLSWTGPVWIGAQMGRNSTESLELVFSGAAGEDIHQKPERYIPLDQVSLGLAQNGKPLGRLQTDSATLESMMQVIGKAGVPREDARFVPLTSRRGDATVVLDVRNGTVLGIFPTDPWNVTNADNN
ncbi:TfpX/TfpZ family type IV pilin accessory protein [Pseudomarimonas arenosa]|uniref:Type IV pilin accessory protein n=1 Tax=Pseudomarimonas arenosa TaxID=2774145 RepID=A0AAW3ZDS2_9GAMM|nr:TfpX/TfpZ family type IV pilin accessory protein [Pseudomarimonas arenosa]MBD8524183.1 hypothetical protein [Pseudomarimonas arenosa]